MEANYCPHCGTKHFIGELNFILLQNINGYKIDFNSIIIEQSVKNKNQIIQTNVSHVVIILFMK